MSWRDAQPLWYKKTAAWNNTFRKACTLKTGQGGMLCVWRGSPCCYDLCPARIFEEVELRDPLYFSAGPPVQVNKDLVRQVSELSARVVEMDGELIRLRKRLYDARISGKVEVKAQFFVAFRMVSSSSE